MSAKKKSVDKSVTVEEVVNEPVASVNPHTEICIVEDEPEAIELTAEYMSARPDRYQYIEKTDTWRDRKTGRFVRSFANPYRITPTNAHDMHMRNMELKLEGQNITRHGLARGAKSKTWQEAYAQLTAQRYKEAMGTGMAAVKAHELLAELSGMKEDPRAQGNVPSNVGNMTVIDKLLVIAEREGGIPALNNIIPENS